MRQLALLAFLTLLLAASGKPARAQTAPTTDPSRLLELRAIYENGKRQIRAAALEKHIAKLAALQTTLARGDYQNDAAIVAAALAERTRELGTLARTSTGTITLTPGQATLRGGLKLTPRYIQSWHSTAASASWTQRGIPAGRYAIYLDYLPVPGGGGSVEMRNLEGRATVRIEAAKGSPPRPLFKKIGSITLAQRKTITFTLAPRSRSAAGIFLLTKIRLVPDKR